MKTPSIILLILLLTAAAFGQQKNDPPTIEVNGLAEIVVQPDEVSIGIDITKLNKDLAVAKSEADKAYANVMAVTKKFDIAPEDVRTTRLSVEMKYIWVSDPKNKVFDEDGDEIGTRTFIGYEVSTNVTILLKDLDRFQELFSDVLKAGVSEIDNVAFRSSRMVELVKEARIKAMKAAHEKASAMAGAIGQTIGKAISIKEVNNPRYGYGDPSANTVIIDGAELGSETLASYSPGSIKVSSQVSVVFLLN